ncbi:ribonuclease domain-containing protein [Streptomyces yaizuensis]|uniref:Guanine-specific ribonuclease N1 and T1 n=1 Tax=Streptomyces yaizuensis TaxID=2989713 RepID=A0ABQ5NXA1_9ACTN|nr:ribonuclease domain-containing protein [Streptomyces sp. YSPA8]GLF94998.1 guanine-specific ribonuclease N1 and T1 [Streptomyces sp. YSPA8]
MAALLLVPFAAPAASPAPAVPVPAAGSPDRALRPADVIEPPLPVEAFPGQVKEACGIWKELTWPRASRATDHPVVNTRLVIRGANVYHNRSGDLPAAGHYREYDVNPRVPGTRRDAERLVRDTDTTAVWYTADHYANFREISSGCE